MRRSRDTAGPSRRARVVPGRARGARRDAPARRSCNVLSATEYFAELDREVFNRLAVRTNDRTAGCRGRLGGNLHRALRAVDVDDPVSGEELLRLGEYAVGDRFAVLSCTHELGLVGRREPFCTHQLA